MTDTPFRDLLSESVDLADASGRGENMNLRLLDAAKGALRDAAAEPRCRDVLAWLVGRWKGKRSCLDAPSRDLYDRITEALKVSRKARRGD